MSVFGGRGNRRGIAVAVAFAFVAFAGGIFATQYWTNPGTSGSISMPGSSTLTPSPSPSSTPAPDSDTVSLTWDRAEVVASADDVFAPPPCGHEFSADPSLGHGIEPIALATHHPKDTFPTSIDVTTQFQSLSGDPVYFLADEQLTIVTRDGIVVTPDWGVVFTPALYTAHEGNPPVEGAPFSFGPSGLCDIADEDGAFWDSFDWENASAEDIAEADRLAREFHERHSEFPPGEYAIYVWTPVVLGEHAAVARALYDLGVTDLPHIEYIIGYTDLVEDPRVMEHCMPDFDYLANVVGYSCDVPRDILREVLTIDVPRDYVVDVPAGSALSAPVIITID